MSESRHDRDSYYQLAEQWDADIIRKAKVSRNRAYVFAALCLAIAGAAVGAVAALAPLKRVEPVVVTYNEQTGVVRTVNYTDDLARLTGDEAVIKNVVNQFVIARETWERGDEDYRRRVVSLLLAPKLLTEYNEEFNSFNSGAMIKKFGDKVVRHVQVLNVSFLNKNTAHVRFVTTDITGSDKTVTNWAAVVGFAFTRKPTNEQDLFINPLGFQVMSYRRDQEVAEPAVISTR